jgi:AcrR family transcriptional regulator
MIVNEKDRSNTEQKLLSALENIIEEDGFEKLGVNAIASKAGVSKVLIYRYFGSVDNMILEFLSQKDFWINFSVEFPNGGDLKEFIKKMFRGQISQLREDKLSQRLHRWELSTNNSIIDKLRLKRESKGITLVTIVSQLSQHPQEEVAALATIMSASITYLTLLSESCPIYNGIDLQSDRGWEQIALGLDLLIDKWYESR